MTRTLTEIWIALALSRDVTAYTDGELLTAANVAYHLERPGLAELCVAELRRRAA